MAKMENERRFMSIAEAAKTLGVSDYSIRRLARQNKLPGYKSGRKFLVAVPELLEMLTRTGGEAAREDVDNE